MWHKQKKKKKILILNSIFSELRTDLSGGLLIIMLQFSRNFGKMNSQF